MELWIRSQENRQLKEQLEYLRSGEYLNQLRFERDMLQDLVDSGEISKEDKEFIDMTHRNTELLQEKEQLEKQNEELKQRLNWVAFGDDPELALRCLRRIGYVGFDEDRKVYINKHNNEPFWLDEEKEKKYYLKDEELSEYTKQLEYQLKQKDEVIDEAIKYLMNHYVVDEPIKFKNDLSDILQNTKG